MLRRLLFGIIVGSLILLLGAYLFWSGFPEETPASPPRPQRPDDMGGMMTATPLIWPGIRQPKIVSAESAHLPDDAEVLGVSVANHHRAYALKAFEKEVNHIVDDLIDGVPVTVTYCNVTHCHKVFTSSETGAPLNIDLGGRAKGELLLKVCDVFYTQKSGQPLSSSAAPFPYPEMPAQVMTWKAWKEAHPDTDVYESPPERRRPGDLPPP
jgi:hypothetical protein